MNQIISDLRFFEGDSSSLSPARTSLHYKGTINNPVTTSSGTVIIDGINFSKFEMNKVNYAVVIAKHPISIVIDKKVIIYTSQFSIHNKNTTMDISIYPRLRYKVTVQYLYGFIKPGGLTSDGTYLSAVQIPEGCCNEEYDEYLKNLIIDTDSCQFNPDLSQFIDNPNCCDNCTYDSVLEDIIYTK